MIKTKIFFLSIICLIFFTSCQKQKAIGDPLKKFKKMITLEGRIIDLGQELIGFPAYDLAKKDSLLFIYDRKKNEDKFLFVIDIKNKKYLGKIIQQGWGPCEFSRLTSLNIDETNNFLYFHEPNKDQLFSLNLDSVVKNIEKLLCPNLEFTLFDKFHTQTDYTDFAKINDKYYVGLGPDSDSNEYAIVDSKGNFVSSTVNYPHVKLPTDYIRNNYNQKLFYGKIKVNSKKNKIAGITESACFDILNWENNNLKLQCRKIFVLPEFSIKTINGKNVPVKTRNSLQGFVSLATTNKAIYVSYCGRFKSEILGSGAISEHILVFTWDGEPMYRYHLNQPILGFVVEGDSVLYGITTEAQIIEYRLK